MYGMDDPPQPPPAVPPPADPASPPAAPDVTPLVGPRSPADHGLSGLGLVMQLGGTAFAAFTAWIGLTIIFMMMKLGSMGASDGGITLWMLAIAGTGVVRSMAHRAAGTRLLYDGPSTPLAGIRRYIGMSIIHIVVCVAFFAIKAKAPFPIIASVTFMFAAWPATLAILFAQARYKQFETTLPLPEDKGFEGAAIMMLILGSIGLGFGLVILYSTLQLPSMFLSTLPGILMVLIMVMIVIRSGLHVNAGYRGVSEVHMDRAVHAATKYGDFGVITAFVASGALLLMVMAAGADVTAMLTIIIVAWLLLAWPLIIRKFFAERQFADLLAGGEAPLHRRAPDLGHSTLGWLLLAFGVMSLSQSLPGALFLGDIDMSEGGMLSNPMEAMFAMMQNGSERSIWWTVGTAGLQIWAGLELIRMTDNHKIVTTIYGVIATGVAIYVNLPALEALKTMAVGGMFSPGGGGGAGNPMNFAVVAIALVVPVASLILVNRKISPSAQARYRSATPGAGAP
jgi:hypothetical protein